MNEYQYNLNVHRNSPIIRAKPFSLFKNKSITKSTFNNYLLCSPLLELKHSNPSMYFRTFTDCNFSSSKKESEINLNDNKNKENVFIINMINYMVERNWLFLNYEFVLEDSNNTNYYKEHDMCIIIINVHKDEKEMKSVSLLTNNDNGEVF